MKVALLAIAAAVLALSLPTLAEQPKAAPSAQTGPAGRVFDPATIVTVAGEVVDVQHVDGGKGVGIHLELKSSSGALSVHLGPAWFLEKQSLKVAKGDPIEVTGSRVMLDGHPALIAQIVKKGSASLTLRDAAGVPAWAGPGQR